MNWNKFLPCILLTTVLGACSGKGEQPNVEPTALCLTDSLLRIVSVDTVHVQEGSACISDVWRYGDGTESRNRRLCS